MLAWIGAALVYYILFSVLFDTPAEYELRHSTDRLKEEYNTLLEEYDSLAVVVENVVERDRNIFAIMFDSEPYNFDSEYNNQRIELHESLLSKNNREMSATLSASLAELEQKMARLEECYGNLDSAMQQIGSKRNNIPSIQPVTNHELTLLTAAYGTLMHPFYRTLQFHQGVDYAVPEGTRIFATADGVVIKRRSVFSENIAVKLQIRIPFGIYGNRTLFLFNGGAENSRFSYLDALDTDSLVKLFSRGGSIFANDDLLVLRYVFAKLRTNVLKVCPTD